MNTEKDRAQQLRRKLQKHAISPDNYSDTIYPAVGIHSNSTIIVANQSLATMTGYTSEELTGMNAWRLFASRSSDLIMEKLKLHSESPYQVYMKNRQGDEFAVELAGKNMQLGEEHIRIVRIRCVEAPAEKN